MQDVHNVNVKQEAMMNQIVVFITLEMIQYHGVELTVLLVLMLLEELFKTQMIKQYVFHVVVIANV